MVHDDRIKRGAGEKNTLKVYDSQTGEYIDRKSASQKSHSISKSLIKKSVFLFFRRLKLGLSKQLERPPAREKWF